MSANLLRIWRKCGLVCLLLQRRSGVPGCVSPNYPSDGLEVYRDASPADYRRVRVYVQSTDATGATGSMYYGFVTSIVRGRSGGKALGNEVYSLTIVAVAE